MVAALLFAAPESGAKLSVLLRNYRRALIRDALLNVRQGDNVVELGRARPGPRSRRLSDQT